MIILASASVARRKLIKMCKRNIIIKSSDIDESRYDNEDIYAYLQRVTYMKGIRFVKSNTTVISADTVIVYKDKMIGKPKNRRDAFNILSMLSGNRHFCFSGVSIMSEYGYEFFVDYAVLRVMDLDKKAIDSYLDKKEYIGKAAAYAIQGSASEFIELVKGDIKTVIGLPMRELCKII